MHSSVKPNNAPSLEVALKAPRSAAWTLSQVLWGFVCERFHQMMLRKLIPPLSCGVYDFAMCVGVTKGRFPLRPKGPYSLLFKVLTAFSWTTRRFQLFFHQSQRGDWAPVSPTRYRTRALFPPGSYDRPWLSFIKLVLSQRVDALGRGRLPRFYVGLGAPLFGQDHFFSYGHGGEK